MSHNYLNKLRTQELITTIKGYLSNISTVLTGLANGDARDNTKMPKDGRLKVTEYNNYTKINEYVYSTSCGIEKQIWDDLTRVIFQCEGVEIIRGGARIEFDSESMWGVVGDMTVSSGGTHFMFNYNNVGDNIGKTGTGAYAGVAQPDSTLDLWYETIRFNGKVMDMFAHSGQSHNAIWRGKYLGNTFTAAQKAAIADGSFDDLFVGDYWTINGVDWVIADIDYYYGFGDTECTTHHLVIVPRYQLLNAKMNTTNTTTGGYLNSEMKTITLLCDSTTSGDTNTVYGMICAAFGENNILSHSMYLTNAIDSSGNVSGWDWVDSKVDLLTQCQVFGEKIWGGANDGFNTGIQNTQLAAFRLNHNFIINKPANRAWYKLCDIWSATQFIGVNARGSAGTLYASNSNGVRPHFCLF